MRELYRVADLPLFQNRTYESVSAARTCPRGDVILVQDNANGLVFNRAFQPDLMRYDPSYQNEQALSPTFRRHLNRVAQLLEPYIRHQSAIEIGCGKGSFLEVLQERGIDIRGFDPAYEGANPRIARRYFDADLRIRADVLLLRHVLEHVQHPIEFLKTLEAANGGGLIYLEVPCLDWILQHHAWYDVFYEHVNYFRLSDFRRMFGVVHELGHLFGGQYIFAVADLASLRPQPLGGTDAVEIPTDFIDSITAPTRGSGLVAVWGAASKGVIFSLLRERSGRPIDVAIDINPAKQGRYLPGTGLLVESPGQGLDRLQPGASIYVMNSNYLEEVQALGGDHYNYIEVDR